ncbi:hypothetical protein HDU76_008562, partial [Blyttiomyces sp. JEL0837]
IYSPALVSTLAVLSPLRPITTFTSNINDSNTPSAIYETAIPADDKQYETMSSSQLCTLLERPGFGSVLEFDLLEVPMLTCEHEEDNLVKGLSYLYSKAADRLHRPYTIELEHPNDRHWIASLAQQHFGVSNELAELFAKMFTTGREDPLNLITAAAVCRYGQLNDSQVTVGEPRRRRTALSDPYSAWESGETEFLAKTVEDLQKVFAALDSGRLSMHATMHYHRIAGEGVLLDRGRSENGLSTEPAFFTTTSTTQAGRRGLEMYFTSVFQGGLTRVGPQVLFFELPPQDSELRIVDVVTADRHELRKFIAGNVTHDHRLLLSVRDSSWFEADIIHAPICHSTSVRYTHEVRFLEGETQYGWLSDEAESYLQRRGVRLPVVVYLICQEREVAFGNQPAIKIDESDPTAHLVFASRAKHTFHALLLQRGHSQELEYQYYYPHHRLNIPSDATPPPPVPKSEKEKPIDLFRERSSNY